MFPEFSGEKFENFTTVAERLRADYEFGHSSDAKLLPHGDASAAGPFVRLFKPFDELFVDFQVNIYIFSWDIFSFSFSYTHIFCSVHFS